MRRGDTDGVKQSRIGPVQCIQPLLQLHHQRARQTMKLPAGSSQADRRRAAIHQLLPDGLLQRLDMAAKGRLGNMAQGSRTRKMPHLGQYQKILQPFGFHAPAPDNKGVSVSRFGQ